MRTASTDFKNAMQAPVKTISGKLVITPTSDEITNEDDLISYTIQGEAIAIGKSVMRKLTAKYLGDRTLVGTRLNVQTGVLLPNDTYEYIDQGDFLVTQCEVNKETETVTLTAYDMMIYTIQDYSKQTFTYPTTVQGLNDEMLTFLGLNATPPAIPFATLDVEVDLYENIEGTQYRKVFEDIAILGGQIVMIDENNELVFRSIKTPTNTVETLDYTALKKLKLDEKYGSVNSLVLSRQPTEDNVILQNEADILANDMTEIKIINNEIIDKRREDVATSIFPYFDGIEYTPFAIETIGLGWYEVGDKILIEDDNAVTWETIIMGISITVDGSLKEKIWFKAPTKTETNYAISGGLNNRIKNTEIIVDKQNQTITSVVEDLETLDGETNANFTAINQDVTNIINSVQSSGGLNLLKNSAFFAYSNSGVPESWTAFNVVGSGNFYASPTAIANGSLSGHVVELDDISYKQTVTVVQGNPVADPATQTHYSFMCMINKEIIGDAKVKITDGINTWEEVITSGTSKNWEKVSFEKMLPESTTLEVSIEGDGDAEFKVTDMMLAVGDYSKTWEQSNGEIMNTQVNISTAGITVKSSVFLGDYTAITPTEFAGYAIINSVLTKVFSLNKDVTEVTKLQADDEISMQVIKIVPLNNASEQGWAFVGIGE